MNSNSIIMEICLENKLDVEYDLTNGFPGSYIQPEEPPEVNIKKVYAFGTEYGSLKAIDILPLLTRDQIDQIEAQILEEILG